MTGRTLAMLMLALAVAFFSGGAAAKGKAKGSDAAKALKADKQGQALEKKKSWEEARVAYEQSLELKESADTRIRLARVDEKLGHFHAALEQLETALAAKKISYGSKLKAQALKKSIEKKMPALVLELPSGFHGKVEVDDAKVDATAPIPVDPGSHSVHVTAEGYKPYDETVDVAEKEKKNLTVLLTENAPEPEPKAPPPPEPEQKKPSGGGHTLAYVSLGVGAVGVVVGSIFALQARSTKADLDNNCVNNVCSESQRDLYDKGKRQADIATVGFAVGAVGIGLGTVLLLTGGKTEKEGKLEAQRRLKAHATPYLGPGSVGVYGQF
jgi:tetratricopeptide (TPR) repeat protein